ncbi:MAG TPA: hypothetical protein VME23_01685 [Terracidiphilus sp.]|nr:hypothetical protein [Terracidiphilus sp.]
MGTAPEGYKTDGRVETDNRNSDLRESIMVLAFKSWMNLSTDFSGTPGTQVAAVPWGNHFALFATNKIGQVCCAGCYLQTGLMGPWKPFSTDFFGVPGAPVAVVPWGKRFALFAVDAKGQAMCAGGDPENGLMGPWKPITEGFETKPGAPVTALAWGHRFALFATDGQGRVCCAGADPQHGLMGPWKPITEDFSGVPGAPVTVLPWSQRFALFAIDAGGIVRCAGADPQHGLVGPWEPISDDFAGTPGAPVSAQPWGNHFALFATDAQGAIRLAGCYLETGLMGPWKVMSDGFTFTAGAAVAVIPWNEAFALIAVDYAGVVRASTGNPEINLTSWVPVPSLIAAAGSPATLVTAGTGLGLFSTDYNGAVWGVAGGAQVMTGFWPEKHGWHFDNTFVNELLAGLITTYGLCGGMAYSSLDYYFNGMPIPTHRRGDFPDTGQCTTPGTCPPNGRLRSMIFRRLIDSFADNFDKWSCIYPDLDAAVAGILGVAGWVFGELHGAFDCPGGGAQGMTKKELPRLIGDFLDNGKPAPLGLIYDRDISHIGESHQVVAYGYAIAGPQTFIYVYDNRLHDTVCMLAMDSQDPVKVVETLTDGSPLPGGNNGTWEGLLVEDHYQSQKPTYGQDIAIDSSQVLQFTGPIINAPVAADPAIVPGSQLTDIFVVKNIGEFQAHYESLGIEIDAPGGEVSYAPPQSPLPGDNILAVGQTQTVQVVVVNFGEALGTYAVKAGYNSTPCAPDDTTPYDPGLVSYWLAFYGPASLVSVT